MKENTQLLSSLDKSQYQKPDYLKRFGGAILTILGSIGSVVTSPGILVGSGIGLLISIIYDRPIFRTTLFSAKIGSLGTLPLLLYGFDLLGATEEPSVLPPVDDLERVDVENPNKIDEIDEDEVDVDLSLSQDKEADKSQKEPEKTQKEPEKTQNETDNSKKESNTAEKIKKIDPHKSTQPIDFKNTEEIKAFINLLKELANAEEAKASPTKEKGDGVPIRESALEALSINLKNLVREADFWHDLDDMTPKEIQCFVRGLSTTKEGGRFSSSEIDYLWRHISRVDFEPRHKEKKLRQFQFMVRGLTDEQLKVSFQSADFTKIFTKDEYLDALANILNAQQLAFVASDYSRHKMLDTLIRKIKPDPFILGKFLAIMPYATRVVRVTLIDWIAHLDYEASFNIELHRLADYYIDLNTEDYRRFLIQSTQSSSVGKSSFATWTPGSSTKLRELLEESKANDAGVYP